MTLVDANVLLYASHRRAPQHERCRAWVEAEFSSGAAIRIPWATIVAFLRISTNPRVFERPLTTAEAETAVASWLALPAVSPVDPASATGTS
jgi:toxin-antitoxin system PIN domain toxin